MRVSTLQLAVQATNSMLDRQAALAKTQEQLATGTSIVKPSDNPLGSVQVLAFNENMEQSSQYQRNADAAARRLELEEATLSNATDVLQAVRERIMRANSGVLSQANRQSIAQEVREDLAQLLGLANTKDSNGDYLFGGHAVNTVPFTETAPGVYTYQGDAGQRSVQIGPTRQMATSDPGSDIFDNLAYSGGGTQDIFTTLASLATTLDTGAQVPAAISDMDAALNQVLTVRARIGSRLNATDDQMRLTDDSYTNDRIALSKIKDLDYAEAITRMNVQMAGLQASQQAYARVQGLSLFNYL